MIPYRDCLTSERNEAQMWVAISRQPRSQSPVELCLGYSAEC